MTSSQSSQQASHWSEQKERANKLGIQILLFLMKIFGPGFVRVLLIPIVFYYYLTSPDTRRVSRLYLDRVTKHGNKNMKSSNRKVSGFFVYQHMLSFAQSMVDRVYSWGNGFSDQDFVINDGSVLTDVVGNQEQGAIIFVSHLGNFDVAISRSQLTPDTTFNIVMNMNHTQTFNHYRGTIFDSDKVRFIDPDSISPATMVDLTSRIEQGEILIIAADRTPSHDENGSTEVSFLGDIARLPVGPYVMAYLLKAPVYTLFSIKQNGKFYIDFKLFKKIIELDRSQRPDQLKQYASEYAKCLESYCVKYPLQWYNFFDFWPSTNKSDTCNYE